MMERILAMNLDLLRSSKLLALILGSLLIPLDLDGLRADQIIVSGGRNYEDVTITGATYEQVQFKLPGVSTSQKVDADKVLQLVFSRESSSLARGRGAFENGDWETAANSFKSATSMGDALKKSSAMYMHGLSLLRWGDADASKYAAAISALEAYLSEFEGKKDFYVPHARMALSEAHRKAGNYSEAESALSSLASGSLGRRWVLGARLGKAQSLLAQDKWPQSREEFSSVSNDSNASTDQICQAWIGYASAQQGQKQWRQAADTIRKQILETRNKEILANTAARAHAWLVWGRSTEEQAGGDAGELQWAMIRYLRAAVMASGGNGEVLAEALYRAKELAKKQGDSERAESLTQRLKQVAPDSRWNK
ncbi:MAG: hypothetical protein CBC13_01900 [Planctomycetia bacterium TMED53]|nr:MAG: hypothetical protein CBC13_01900 [Planctomycetia bacterium TMED53]